jgi:hypothetical protein
MSTTDAGALQDRLPLHRCSPILGADRRVFELR